MDCTSDKHTKLLHSSVWLRLRSIASTQRDTCIKVHQVIEGLETSQTQAAKHFNSHSNTMRQIFESMTSCNFVNESTAVNRSRLNQL